MRAWVPGVIRDLVLDDRHSRNAKCRLVFAR
jgi:hypothetical protein